MAIERLRIKTINIKQGFDEFRCGKSQYNFSPRKRDKIIRGISEEIQTEARENRIKGIKSEESAANFISD